MDIIRTHARLTDITALAISTAASLLELARGSAGDMADIGEVADTEAGDLTVAASAVAEQ
jgi:hypothetical protein